MCVCIHTYTLINIYVNLMLIYQYFLLISIQCIHIESQLYIEGIYIYIPTTKPRSQHYINSHILMLWRCLYIHIPIIALKVKVCLYTYLQLWIHIVLYNTYRTFMYDNFISYFHLYFTYAYGNKLIQIFYYHHNILYVFDVNMILF